MKKNAAVQVNRAIKICAILLVFALLMPFGDLMIVTAREAGGELGAAATDAVITVNFIYQSNNAMVTQPYTAQAEIGSSFEKTVAVSEIVNYYTPVGNVEVTGDDTGVDYITSEKQNGADTTTVVNAVVFDIEEVTGDVTVNVYYVAGTAEYTVKHYYQNLEDDDYAEPVVVGLTGDIDAYTEAMADTSKTGFYCTGVPQYIIAADGTTTVNIYYNRYYFTVVFDVNGGVNGPDPIYGKYGTTYDAGAILNPTRAGYDFAGWAPSPSGIVDSDVTYQAQWIPSVGNADYTIVIWGQNANDDEYSYMSSHGAHGAPGDEVTWMPDAYICEGAHTHTANCYVLSCVLDEHTHSAACGVSCTHTHTAACFGGTTQASPSNAFVTTVSKNGLVSGRVYNVTCSALSHNDYNNQYYLYYEGHWYNVSSRGSEITSFRNNIGDHLMGLGYDTVHVYNAADTCPHPQHDDSCYTCGKVAHTHVKYDANCYTLTCDKTSHTHTAACLKMGSLAPKENGDSSLWVYDHSDTVTVDADGSTVLNVYFNRKEFTLTFHYGNNNRTTETLTRKWGESIGSEWMEISGRAGNSKWSRSSGGSSPWTNYLDIMPQENRDYYDTTGNSTRTVYYYGEDINGTQQLLFSVTSKGNSSSTVSNEDCFPILGYTYSSRSSNTYNGCRFYYTRNSYNLIFYSASPSVPDKTESVKYQDNLGNHKYNNPVRPGDVEADAVFVGWYQNPECSGEPFDLDAHIMPANNIALYAKWVNGLYTIETFTDDTLTTPYTYEGYTGRQENVVKYTLADAPIAPSKEGQAFVGWFYEENGVEKPFSFTMPITKDYQLYPKFTTAAVVNYTVHYYKAGTTEKVADDRTSAEMIGNTVTERAKMGTDLNLVGDAYNSFFPDKTSTSVELTRDGMEIIFYYTNAEEVGYTVKYQDAEGNNLLTPVEKTTNYSTVVERYVPIENYTSRFFSITEDIKAGGTTEIIFVYDENTYEIRYEAVGNGSVSPESETVGIVTGSPAGSTATPDEHYKLDGWYSDPECTVKVGSGADFVPTENKEATYYAKFVLDVADYTVKHVLVNPDGTEYEQTADQETKSGTIGTLTEATANTYANYTAQAIEQQTIEANGSTVVTVYYDRQTANLTIKKSGWDKIDENQTFIFDVDGAADDPATSGFHLTVTVHGNGQTTIVGLPVGNYTVTEQGWSWRYTASGESTVSVESGVNNVFTALNERTVWKWLDGDNYNINIFTR